MDTDARTVAHLERALADGFADLLTPALVIDLDAVDHNIQAMITHVGDPRRWRPHLKTSKQSVIVTRLLAAGIRDFKVATLDELELLLVTSRERATGPVDVVLAYPLLAAAIDGFVAVREQHATTAARVSLIADSPAHARMLEDRLAQLGARQRTPLLLDVDLGMNRTGTTPEDWSTALAGGLLDELAACQLVGLHGYDGHFATHEREATWHAYDRLCTLAEALRARAGGEAPLDLVTSGTHSFDHALAHRRLSDGPWRAQVSPGTIVLDDLRSQEAAERLGLRQAAFVATRVISRAPGRVTLDAGSKAITPDGSPPTSRVLDWPRLIPGRASEEHLPCAAAAENDSPELGRRLWLVPDHVCTTVNLHREAIWIRGGEVVGWGPVEASGHRCWGPGSPRRGGTR